MTAVLRLAVRLLDGPGPVVAAVALRGGGLIAEWVQSQMRRG
jgi:hypothetical protein